MVPLHAASDTTRFRDLLAHRLGLSFEDAKLEWLSELLHERLRTLRQDPAVYLSRLEAESMPGEIGTLAEALTVPETYFFRNREQFDALSDVALPDRLAARAGVRQLRILSAGCASGEETYSLAMTVRDVVDPSWAVSILGVDANPAVVRKAIRARYSAWALREMTPEARQRWFRRDGREFALEDTFGSVVRFEVANLVDDDPRIWQPRTYDVIFFRNVLMYFTPATAHAVIRRIANSLQHGGYLFLGHAETLRGLSGDFHLQHTHGTFYYRLQGPLDSARSAAQPQVAHTRSPVPAGARDVPDTWVDAIQRASERIGALSDAAHAPRETGHGRGWDLGGALDFLHQERFLEALALLDRLPPEAAQDPDVLLLKAALQTHGGRLEAAERTCRLLLEIDQQSAGAHYLLALCREHAGDYEGAMHQDRVAIHLDPDFAMPYLHLGLLTRRIGDRDTAHRELERALPLLDREDAARLRLFGGGFGRRALVELCRTELQACGGGR
ncbi:MAG TPA: CheR family methyltransferase [Vicinamibacterales bacterium]